MLDHRFKQHPYSNFGPNLKRLLRERNLSYARFADLAGLSSSRVSNYINQRVMPREDTILSIAEFLHVSPSELLDAPRQTDFEYAFFNPDPTPVNKAIEIPYYGDIKNGPGLYGVSLPQMIICEENLSRSTEKYFCNTLKTYEGFLQQWIFRIDRSRQVIKGKIYLLDLLREKRCICAMNLSNSGDVVFKDMQNEQTIRVEPEEIRVIGIAVKSVTIYP